MSETEKKKNTKNNKDYEETNYWKTIFEKLGPVVSSTLGTISTQIPALFQALVSAVAPIIPLFQSGCAIL